MAEEPRRSVRSTKGMHSHKEQEIEGSVDTPKKKASGKKAGSKKSTEASQVGQKDDNGDIINCICGATTQDNDDEGEEWVCCETCETWQHNVCMGIPTDDVKSLPDYYCQNCQPESHQELLQAITNGEPIWETRRAKHDAGLKNRKNRKSKGGNAKKRKSDSKAVTEHTNGKAQESPAASSYREGSVKVEKESKTSSAKRKARDESQDRENAGKMKQRKVSLPSTNGTRYKALTDLPSSIDGIDDPLNFGRKNFATFIHKKMDLAVKNAEAAGRFEASPEVSAEKKALELTIELEQAIHSTHPNKEQYVEKSRTIATNLGLNQELCDKLLSGELSVGQLAVMKQEDMKNSELRQKDEAVAARAERQATMIADEQPRIRRTHKGEEIVEDAFGATNEVLSREQRDPNAGMAIRSVENSPDELIQSPSDFNFPPRPKQPLSINTQIGAHDRKPSIQTAEFDYAKVASKLPTPTHPQPDRRPSGPAIYTHQTIDDPDVDRMLEDGPESPPYSPKEDIDPSVVWRGEVVMSSIASFEASAKWIGGSDFAKHKHNPDVPTYMDILGDQVLVSGRMEPQKADEYLCGLQYSPLDDLICITLTPCGQLATEEFNKIFDYFVQKKKFAVLGSKMGPAKIRDIYMIPMGPGHILRPGILDMLADVELPPHYEEERSMLVVIVYRDGKIPAETPAPVARTPEEALEIAMNTPIRLYEGGPRMRDPSPTTYPQLTPRQNRMVEAWNRGNAMAKRILGPEFINAPTIAFIMPQAGTMSEREWWVIKEVFEADERAQHDLLLLGQMIADRANKTEQGGQEQNNASDQPSAHPVKTERGQ